MAVIDFYPEINRNILNTIGGGGNTRTGQSFMGNGNILGSISIWMQRGFSPTTAVTLSVYAHSGTYGTSSVATGGALASSLAIPVLTLPTAYALVNYPFTGANRILLASGTPYVWDITYSDGAGTLDIGMDSTSPTHAGNATLDNAAIARDACFYVYSAGSTFLTKSNLRPHPFSPGIAR